MVEIRKEKKIVLVSATGAIVGEQRYCPYGATWFTSGTIYTDKLFTIQREITGLSICHYKHVFICLVQQSSNTKHLKNFNFFIGKKWNSPYINRFLSPDTIVPNPYNPQDLNRFSYVRNNPIRYTDPTGHFCSDPEDLWSPGCDGSGNPPPVTTPPPAPAPVVIINPDPLDDGQEQDDPTPTPDPIDGGLRWPDYISINGATGWPFGLVGLDIQVTRDYYNNWYLSLGIYIGTPGVTAFGGWILERPLEHDIEGFITSHSIFGGGGYWGGGGGNWGHPFDGELNWNDFSGEAGFSSPGGAGGWTYGFLVYDNGDITPWITWQDIVDQMTGANP